MKQRSQTLRFCFILLSAMLWLAACGSATPTPTPEDAALQLEYDFAAGAAGWESGFADLPVDYDPAIYELEAGFTQLPGELEGNGLCIQGHNRSDDLFMFFKSQIEGLRPETLYETAFLIDLATNVPEGLVGIGGAPGESVYVKVGASPIEPAVVEDEDGWLRMNIDKGNQAQDGNDMVLVGNIAHPSLQDEERYEIKTLTNEGSPVVVTSDGDGRLWLIVGTDSGFEGLTAICYGNIIIELNPVE